MTRKINRVKIFSNNNLKSRNTQKILTKKLLDNNFIITDDDYELAIAVGGDGSFLRMVKQTNFNEDVFYVGINTGTLGFAQEVKIKDIDSFICDLNDNDYKIEYIGIQETKVETDKKSSYFYSLNEILIREKDLNTSILKIKIDDVLLEKFVGDGILISTSFGSTAYNLSFGGSIVYNTLHTLQITPIAPLNNKSYRNLLNSVIIPQNKIISIFPEKRNLIIVVDGENNIYDNVVNIETVVLQKRIKVIKNKDYAFAKKINEKFLK